MCELDDVPEGAHCQKKKQTKPHTRVTHLAYDMILSVWGLAKFFFRFLVGLFYKIAVNLKKTILHNSRYDALFTS